MKGCSEGCLAYLSIHLCVALWGFTAILGKLISYGSFTLVLHRMTITFLVFLVIPGTFKGIRELDWKKFGNIVGVGVLVACHWVCFYGSIKLADSASVTLACMGCCAFFSAIIEPFVSGGPFNKIEIVLGLLAVVGVLFIYISLPPETGTNYNGYGNDSNGNIERTKDYKMAVVVGVVAALLATIFTVLNKSLIDQASPLAISALEMGAGAIMLLILSPWMGIDRYYPQFDPNNMTLETIRQGPWDLIWVFILSILCTNVPFYLSTWALLHLDAFTNIITCNLEPVYGIALGALIFKENHDLNVDFYIGTSIILLAVFASPVVNYMLYGTEGPPDVQSKSRSGVEMKYTPVRSDDIDEEEEEGGEQAWRRSLDVVTSGDSSILS